MRELLDTFVKYHNRTRIGSKRLDRNLAVRKYNPAYAVADYILVCAVLTLIATAGGGQDQFFMRLISMDALVIRLSSPRLGCFRP